MRERVSEPGAGHGHACAPCGRALGGSLLAFTTALLPAVRCVELPCRALLPCSCRLPSPLQDPPTLSPHRRPPIAHARRSRDVQAHAERYHCCSTDSFGRTHSTLKALTGGGRREGPSRHAPGAFLARPRGLATAPAHFDGRSSVDHQVPVAMVAFPRALGTCRRR